MKKKVYKRAEIEITPIGYEADLLAFTISNMSTVDKRSEDWWIEEF